MDVKCIRRAKLFANFELDRRWASLNTRRDRSLSLLSSAPSYSFQWRDCNPPPLTTEARACCGSPSTASFAKLKRLSLTTRFLLNLENKGDVMCGVALSSLLCRGYHSSMQMVLLEVYRVHMSTGLKSLPATSMRHS